MAAFFTGLLSGGASGLLDYEARQHKEKLDEIDKRREIIKVVMPSLPHDMQGRALELLLGISPETETGKGKGKGKGNADQQRDAAYREFIDQVKGSGQVKPTPGIVAGPGGPPDIGGAGTAGAAGAAGAPAGTIGSARTPPIIEPTTGEAMGQAKTPPVFSLPKVPGTQNLSPSQQFSVPPMPQAPGTQALSVGAMPQNPFERAAQERAQEQIDLEKMKATQITGPEKEAEHKARMEEEAAKEKAQTERETAKDIATQEREDTKEKALNLRLKNQQNLQLSLERLKEVAADNRMSKHDAVLLRMTNIKAAEALERQAIQDRQKNITGTIADLQKQLTQATSVYKARESEAAKMRAQAAANPIKQKLGMGVDWSQLPDVQAAQEDIDNAKAALAFLTDHKVGAVSGKEDLEDITAKTEDILRNGPQTQSKSDWIKNNPGRSDVDAVMLKLQKQGIKVIP